MNSTINIQLMPGSEAALVVDPFYEQEGKTHRARNSDLFFAAFIENTIVGVCRFCIEVDTPLFCKKEFEVIVREIPTRL